MSFNKKPKTINPNEVDPSVYYYDEVYDEMQEDGEVADLTNKYNSKQEGSKYIKGLIETAELRKSEKDIRVFKKYAKDRERAKLDGDACNQDVYISASYKKRLKEIEILEAEKAKRLSLEKDNRMNFTKNSDVPANNDTKLPTAVECKDAVDITVSEEEVSRGPTAEKKSKPKLNTAEERRKFLKKLLAKRTVGRIYDEAVQRYLERKSVHR